MYSKLLFWFLYVMISGYFMKNKKSLIKTVLPLFFIAAAIAFVFLYKQPKKKIIYSKEALIMGTTFRMEFSHADSKKAIVLEDKVVKEIKRLEKKLSPYINDSEISIINRQAAIAPVKVSVEMLELLQFALEMGEKTDGVFDISYASVGRYYDFRSKKAPNTNIIQEKLKAINYKNIILNKADSSVSFISKECRINLGGFAKGYAAEVTAKILKQGDADYGQITIGGDTYLFGRKYGKNGWRIGIKNPDRPKEAAILIQTTDSAVSTSGNYERFFFKNGERIHHIINPKTGKSAKGIKSVTIIGKNGAMCDALSTTLLISGEQKGLALINSIPDYEAIMITDDDRVITSNNANKFIVIGIEKQ